MDWRDLLLDLKRRGLDVAKRCHRRRIEIEFGFDIVVAASRKYSRLPPAPRIAGISSSPSPTGEWKVCTFRTSARVTKWQWTAHKKRLASAAGSIFVRAVEQPAALTVRHAVPAIYQHRDFPAAGGLMSYGSDVTDSTA